MSRLETLQELLEKFNNKYFLGKNIKYFMDNLIKADRENRLPDFLLCDKPYKWPDGVKDLLAMIAAVNFYGARRPGFPERLNRVLKDMAWTDAGGPLFSEQYRFFESFPL